jgi:hypothetical protein
VLSEESTRRLKYCLHWLQVRFVYLIFIASSLLYSPIYLFTFFIIKKIVHHSSHRRPNPDSTRLYSEPPTSPQHHLRIHLAPPAHLGRTYAQAHRCEKGYRAYHSTGGGCGVQVCRGRVARAGEREGEGVYFEVAAAVGE